MRASKETSTINPAGSPKLVRVPEEGYNSEEDYKRGDFFRDLKRVVRKLPPDHPSRSGSQKR